MASEHVAAKRAALRLRIIEVALKAFAARGFEATTMTEVADQLQMTGPALYHYFSTKEQLLFTCLEQLLSQLLAEVTQAGAAETTAGQRMAAVVRAQVAFEIRYGNAASLINAHLYGPDYLTSTISQDHQAVLREKQRAVVQVYRDLIESGTASGEFDPGTPAIAAFNVLAVIQYAGVWFRPGKGRRMADTVEEQVQAVGRLLGARSAPTPRRRGTRVPG